MIFVDRQCPACHGKGCKLCHGTGIISSFTEGVYMSKPHVENCGFADRLRAWRLYKGLTHRELAVKLGLSPGTLSEIENGRREPTEEQREKIEEVMYDFCWYQLNLNER